MSRSAPPDCEPKSTSTLPEQPGVLVVRKHHFLVRWNHWLNVPILLGLVLSGISIYWASPIYQHKPDPNRGNMEEAADIGIWICAHVPRQHHYSSPPDWIYNHMSLGPAMLALALRLHWLCAYLFMLNGMVYAAGLIMGLTRSGCFDTTSVFPSLNWRAANGCIPALTLSTTRCNAQHTSLFRSPGSFRSLRDGRFTSLCNSIGCLRFSEGMTQRVSGISG